MLAKYKIEYAVPFNGHGATSHSQLTDDPVACEAVLSELLERGFLIRNISHEGVELPRVEADRMIKLAAGMMTTKRLCTSLQIDPAEAHHRFGSPA
jgi:hypothetical protein